MQTALPNLGLFVVYYLPMICIRAWYSNRTS